MQLSLYGTKESPDILLQRRKLEEETKVVEMRRAAAAAKVDYDRNRRPVPQMYSSYENVLIL